MNEVSLNSECAYEAEVMWCRETDQDPPSGGTVGQRHEGVKQHVLPPNSQYQDADCEQFSSCQLHFSSSGSPSASRA